MQNLRALGLVALLAVAAGIVYWLTSTQPDDLPTPDNQTNAPADAPHVDPSTATGTATTEPEKETDPARTQVASSTAGGSGPALVGKVLDESGQPVAGAIVSTGLTTMFSPRSFDGSQIDFDDMAKTAARARERMNNRAAVATGADGTFRLVPDGEGAQLQIEAKARAFVSTSRMVDRPKGQDVDVGTLVLQPGAVIAGRVTDNEGNPIAQASVLRMPKRDNPAAGQTGVTRQAFPAFAGMGNFGGGPDFMPGEMADVMAGLLGDVLTDGEGRFEFAHAPSGDFSLRVRHKEHPSETRDGLSVLPGQTTPEVTIVMSPGADIRGVVRNMPEGAKDLRVLAAMPPPGMPAGQNDPFGGMGQQLMEMAGDFALTAERSADVAADGSFALRGLPLGSRFRIWVTQGPRGITNTKVCSQRLEVASGASGVELDYDPGISVTFTVLDSKTDQPVERMLVRKRFEGGNDMAAMVQGMLGDGARLETFPGGKVEIPSLRPKKDQKLRLTIEAIGYGRLEKREIVLPASGALDLGTLKLDPMPVVRVQVTSKATGRPVEGARVRLRGAGRSGRQGGGNLEEMMAQGGRGMFGGNNPLAGRNQDLGTQTTDADGRAVLNARTEGAFAVVVDHEDHAPYRSADLEAPTVPIDHAVTLVVGGHVVVTALDADGNPIKNARIETQPAGANGESDFANADDKGVATFAHRTPGMHKFRLATRGMGGDIFSGMRRGGNAGGNEQDAAWTEAEVADGAEVEVVLSKAATATLSGVVRQNGQPLAGARVAFVEGAADAAGSGDPMAEMIRSARQMGGGGGGRNQRTGEDGTYTIKELPAGQHRVRVTSGERAMPTVVPVFLRLGANTLDLDLDVASLAGVVVDPEGKPVADASVRVARADDNGMSLESLMQGMPFGGGRRGGAGGAANADVKTDEQGRFTVTGVQSGTALVVRASKTGFAGGVSQPVDVPPGGSRDTVEVRLVQGGTLVVTTAQQTQFGAVIATYEGTDVKGVSPVVGMVGNSKATLEGLRPGTWRVKLQGFGGFGGMGGQNAGANGNTDPGKVVTISAGQTAEVTL